MDSLISRVERLSKYLNEIKKDDYHMLQEIYKKNVELHEENKMLKKKILQLELKNTKKEVKNMWTKIREWSSEFTSPFAEAIKEAFRDVLFAVPSALIVLLPQLGVVEKSALGGLVFLFLRSLDKYLYEKSKNTKPNVDIVGGLSPV